MALDMFKLVISGILSKLELQTIAAGKSKISPPVRCCLWRETTFKCLPLTSLSAAPLLVVSDDLSLKYSSCTQEGRGGGGVTGVLTACDSNELHSIYT